MISTRLSAAEVKEIKPLVYALAVEIGSAAFADWVCYALPRLDAPSILSPLRILELAEGMLERADFVFCCDHGIRMVAHSGPIRWRAVWYRPGANGTPFSGFEGYGYAELSARLAAATQALRWAIARGHVKREMT